jgi:hypothetical protein
LHNLVTSVAVTGVVALGLSLPGVAPAGEKDVGTKIRDLYYGEVLFHFFQQDDFTALTHLLAAREAGRVTNHASEAELLLGGLYLSYGQHARAGEIFARLLDESVDPAVRDRAWLYIGKARYERAQYAAADEAFSRVGESLPPRLDAEFQMLRAQSLMARGRFSDASALLRDWDGQEGWLAYANFNLGVALVRMQQIDEGAKRLDSVGQVESDQPEIVALRDKANLALGYAYLQAEKPELAKPILQRVRVEGPFSNKALLGVGWADVMLQDYRSALHPWLALQDRDLLDSAVQEALLAVPYAFSRLGADGSAAEHYVAAMSHFDNELRNLDGAIRHARDGRLLPALLQGDDGEIGRWHWNLEELPDTDDARYLYHLIANHRFQDGLRSYRDLIGLRDHLEEWRSKLATFEDMVENRRLAYSRRLPEVEDRLAEVNTQNLAARRDELAARIARIERERDFVGLANENETRLWQELLALEFNIAFGTDKGAAARNKHRILKGTLQWQLDADYRYRLWMQKRGLAELDEQLALTREYEARVLAARDEVPRKLDEYANRIAALTPRLEAMQTQIATVLDEQTDFLTLVATEELEAQKKRLASYRVQARFALATIYDEATVAAREIIDADGEAQ